MKYRILVFVKQVPDTQNITGDAMTPEGTVNRSALPAIFNPEDLNALEAALKLKETCGAHVTAATMGPPSAAEVLRACLCRGADEAVLLTDRAFAGADTLATSYALSCCAAKLAPYDLILCGRQAIDGDTAQVGPQIAEKLNLPQLCYTQEILSFGEGRVSVRRAIEGGSEVLESPTPALLTVVEGNDPRPCGVKRVMKYKKARTPSEVRKAEGEKAGEIIAALEKRGLLIREWNAAECGADPARIGLAGSPTKVKQVTSVVLTAGEVKSVEPTAAGIAELMHELISDHTLG